MGGEEWEILPTASCGLGVELLIRPFISAIDGSDLNRVMIGSDLYVLEFNPSYL